MTGQPEKYTTATQVLDELANDPTAHDHAKRQWRDTVYAQGCVPTSEPTTRVDADTNFLRNEIFIVTTGWVRPVTPDAITAAHQRALEAAQDTP